MARLIACASCGCHALSSETRCPSCNAALRTEDGAVYRTPAAILLGLTIAVTAVGGCGSETSTQTETSAGGGGNEPNGTGGYQVVSTYGVGPSTGGNSAVGGAPAVGGASSDGGAGGANAASTGGGGQ